MKKKFCAAIALTLAITLCVSGCAKLFPIDSIVSQETKKETKTGGETEEETEFSVAHPVASARDNKFTLRYNPESSLNPFSGVNADNMAIAGLMYEGLFSVDADFHAEECLCAEYSTENGKNYVITLRDGLVFSDGTAMTAKDVVYSVTRARNTGRYAARLANVVSTVAMGDNKVSITLARPDYNFPVLLDVPMVKSDTGFDPMPIGTGPYVMRKSGEGENYLSAVAGHRYEYELPVQYIYLEEVNENSIIDGFSTREIDLLRSGAGGAADYNIHVETDSRIYDTTALTFVGFNTRHTVTTDPVIRRAISYALDRDFIYENILGENCRPAPLIFPSYMDGYDTAWESSVEYSIQKTSEIFAEVGMDDYSQNGYLDYPIGEDNWREFTLIVIVNQEDEKKVEIAENVADTLRKIGLNAEVQTLPWAAFTAALQAGEFDLYVGEAQVQSNFDFSAFFNDGGAMNYGKISNSKYKTYIDAFTAAADAETKKAAAKDLAAFAAEDAAILPIAYERASVVTHRNAVRGIAPSQSNIFRNIWEWKITP